MLYNNDMNNHALPDIVYPLKKKSQYEELRYSLRSLKNIPHGRVFIAGEELPKWAKNITHIYVRRFDGESGYMNADRNWLEACMNNELSEEFIAMNDDMFFMKPIPELPYYHDGELAGYIKYRESLGDTHENYLIGMKQTLQLLREHGVEKPLGYTLHIPMRMKKSYRLALHGEFAREYNSGQLLLTKTLYGNLFHCFGTQRVDVKFINDNFDPDETFLSTNDPAFKYEKLGHFIRSKFPEKSEYEI